MKSCGRYFFRLYGFYYSQKITLTKKRYNNQEAWNMFICAIIIYNKECEWLFLRNKTQRYMDNMLLWVELRFFTVCWSGIWYDRIREKCGKKIEKHFTGEMLPQNPLKLITVVLQYDLNPHHCTIDLNTFFFRTLLQCLWEKSLHVRLSRTIDQKFISKNSESDSCGSSI